MSSLRSIHPRLWVGGQDGCCEGSPECAVVHACKTPCHQRAIGYAKSLPREHPNYLARADAHDLWLNLIDPPVPLFQLESFQQFFAFAAPRYDAGQALRIHCNQGESRSASLALLLLSRHLQVLSQHSYAEALAGYVALDPASRPGRGLAQFLEANWHLLACCCARCLGADVSNRPGARER